MNMRLWSGYTCLADLVHTMINVWTKYDEPRLYGKKETNYKILTWLTLSPEKQNLCHAFNYFLRRQDKNANLLLWRHFYWSQTILYCSDAWPCAMERLGSPAPLILETFLKSVWLKPWLYNLMKYSPRHQVPFKKNTHLILMTLLSWIISTMLYRVSFQQIQKQ